MKKIIRTGMLLTVVAFAGQACKKSSSKSKTEYLTQSGWKQTAQKVRNSPTAAWGPNLLAGISACELDDITLFKTDGKYENNEGATKCNPSDPQVFGTGTWSFQDGESKLNVDGDIGSVDQLDDNTLIVSSSETFGGSTIYYQSTFSH